MEKGVQYTVIGDLHCRPDNLDKCQAIFDICEELGNTVIWLGDILDTKEVIRGKCLNLLSRNFTASKLKHIVLVGNHDFFNLSCLDHSLEPLKALPNVTIVDRPMTIDGMGFLPYTHDINEFTYWLSLMEVPVLFIHQGITGFDYGNGFKEVNGVGYEAFEPFKLVISGHFHTYQKKGNLVYLGTPFTHAFGETITTKYIGIFSKAANLDLIETNFPRHVTGTINANIPDDLEDLVEMMFDESDYNRIILEGSQEKVQLCASIIKEAFPNYKVIEKPTQANQEVMIDEREDNISKFTKWATEIRNLDEETVDLGVSILRSNNV